jgi:hypothetical protein
VRLTVVAVLALVAVGWIAAAQPDRGPLRLAATIPMPGVDGRIDHLAVDVAGKRLFVAALGNDTLEVIDLAAGRVARSVRGLREPQGLRFLADHDRLVVADGGDGAVLFYDGRTIAPVHTAKTSGDADNVRYDAAARRVYVGYGSGALAVFDRDGRFLGDAALPGHPESFQLEAAGPRIFVNVPSARQVAVVDRGSRAVVATWPVSAEANYPMALDDANHRLFVGCRRPATLLVYDTAKGAPVASLPIAGDTDDLFYDEARRRLYVIGGEGAVTVIDQRSPDRYLPLQTVTTAAGARTGLFVPELATLFVAVPHRGAQGAEIRAYAVGS